MATVKSYTKTAAEAKGRLWHAIVNDAIHRADEVDAVIDAFADAVRAETLVPATRGQSAEFEGSFGRLRNFNAIVCWDDQVIISREIDRLRAALSVAEENLRLRTIDVMVHSQHVDSMREERDLWRKRAENAELRRLYNAARGAGK